jgi:hypothetical protein
MLRRSGARRTHDVDVQDLEQAGRHPGSVEHGLAMTFTASPSVFCRDHHQVGGPVQHHAVAIPAVIEDLPGKDGAIPTVT